MSDTTQTPQLQDPPHRIDVLGKKFRIKKMSPDYEPNADGLMELDKQILWYREKESLSYNQDTVLHELIHAADETLHLGMKEQQVHQLAAALLAIIKHNPDFVNWLLTEDHV
jgi:hypothetical protein